MSSSLLLQQELPSVLSPLPPAHLQGSCAVLQPAPGHFQLVQVHKDGKREDANGRMREGLVSF